ncbi:hypothetical protein C8R44DRAFT_561168, partial [Mycena epipterygia]
MCFFRHALALDERRGPFLPRYATRASDRSLGAEKSSGGFHTDVKEVWFAATHVDM